ncbi:MAG: HlyD family efflux transporter periplasmic adaptor subunit [Melioribacteraceae bacterium]|nr:HlyD family efflux transporter periplasmic adaptor subunit [Melioribacteraceae bacterium]
MEADSNSNEKKSLSEKIDQKLENSKLPGFLKNKITLALISFFVLIIVISVFGSVSSDESLIPTYKVKRGNFLVSLTESGELKAKRSLPVPAPRINSRNLKITYLVDEGTYVDSGTIVMKYDPTEMLQRLQEIESTLEIAMSDKKKLEANHKSAEAQMESDLKSAELSYELSKLNLEQMKFEADVKRKEAKLNHQKDELSYNKTKQDYESKKIIRRSEMAKMEIEIGQKESDVEKVRGDINALTVTAPSEGLIVYGTNWQNNGQKFSVGDQPWPGQVVITLPDLSSMESKTSVNEVDVSKIKAGQNVTIKLDAFQDSSYTGQISAVAKLGKKKSNDSNIKVFEVTVAINGISEILRPGMTTSNQIVINEIPDQLFVPLEALFEKGEESFVYVKNGSGFDEYEVIIGEKSEDYVVIKSGLEADSEVALRDPTLDIDNKENEQTVNIPNSEG